MAFPQHAAMPGISPFSLCVFKPLCYLLLQNASFCSQKALHSSLSQRVISQNILLLFLKQRTSVLSFYRIFFSILLRVLVHKICVEGLCLCSGSSTACCSALLKHLMRVCTISSVPGMSWMIHTLFFHKKHVIECLKILRKLYSHNLAWYIELRNGNRKIFIKWFSLHFTQYVKVRI